MKEKITTLHFKHPKPNTNLLEGTGQQVSGGKQKFALYKNTNEGEDALDISIHDRGIKDEDLVNGKLDSTKIKVFQFQINNSIIPNNMVGADSISPDEIIIKKTRSSVTEAIYQFSIPFTLLLPNRDNVVLVKLFEAGADVTNNPSILDKFNLEFFTETEDNFVNVRLERPGTEPTKDQVLWTAIKENLKFPEYSAFIDRILCITDPTILDKQNNPFDRYSAKNRSPFIRSQEYNLIKFGTEFYMLTKFGLHQSEILSYLGDTKVLPYYNVIVDRIKDDLAFHYLPNPDQSNDCYATGESRLENPFMIELIWSYWMEQAGLVQSLNVINLRFQNIKGNTYADRLQRFDADPLRPLSHILWGYIQDEQHRLSIPRRINEYDHEYGLILTGRAVPVIRTVDSRVQFLESFHNLLNQCIFYFRESDDTTRIADAFPILNSLKEVHLLLAEGNHNAYGNLTWTARHEMMMQQYILARPEMREFLGGRTMVPYPETWMDRIDTMRSIQGWNGAGVMYYYELAIHGEQILLSIRYGNWSDVTLRGENAANWAREFRNSIQRYVHAYRAVTGVDLSAERVQLTEGFAVQPAYLIQQRMMLDKPRVRRA